MRLGRSTFFLSILTGCRIFAQAPTWETSGNGLFNSSANYYFREVTWTTSGLSNQGALSDASCVYGTMTFSGGAPGTYAMAAASYVDASSGESGTLNPVSGTYAIGGGGFGYITDPLSGIQIRGMVANGVFIGSATESSGYNNLLIVGEVPSSTPTVSTFSGAYTMGYVNYASANPQYFEDAQFTLNPNGGGTAAQGAMIGYYAGNGTTPTGQAANNLKYSASNGAIVLNFPAAASSAATLIGGQEYLYFSPDGNFVFGGSPTGFDMLVGVKNTSGNATLSGTLWYNAGVYNDVTGSVCDASDLISYYGSFEVESSQVVKHQRLFSSVCSGTYSDISTDTNPSTDATETYIVGDNGNVRIGIGVPPYLGLDIALLAPASVNTGESVYLNPTGVLNNSSNAPFTSGVAPGEILALYGTNLAPSGVVSATTAQVLSQLPTQLNGVSVLIDGLAAPLYYVSPGQIAAIVPYDVSTFSVATIQVKNNGVLSNLVSEPVDGLQYAATPGVSTYQGSNGASYAAAEHLDGSIVTEDSPAQPGETIAVYLTGLGAVFPTIADGVPGPSGGDITVDTISVDIGGITATVGYSGLSGFAGLNQLNVTIPTTGVSPGDNFFDVGVTSPSNVSIAYSSQAIIPIGSGSALAVPASKGAEVQNGQAQKARKHWNPRPSENLVAKKP
ncbi:MAG: hypothetical protein ABSF12_07325 [Bryobacteraceae bacterium]